MSGYCIRTFKRPQNIVIRFHMIMEILGQRSILMKHQMQVNFDLVLQAIPRLKKTEKQITGDGILLTEKIRPDGQLCWTR